MTMQDLFSNSNYDTLGLWVENSDEKFYGVFSCCRIPDGVVPEGCFKYSIREDDDEGEPTTIEKFVGANHFGDVILTKELPFEDREFLELNGLDWGTLESIMEN